MTPAQRKNFDRLLSPRHIAFVGGTDAVVAIGEARRRGFTGEYWAVNPKRKTLSGLPCFASIEDLPKAPDAVFLAIPASPAVKAVKQLARIGAGGIVCYSAGFKEAGGNGYQLETELRDAVGDMALIGPNCYGLVNYLDNVALWPFAHGGSSPGYGAAIITQSGMFSSDISMSQRSLPLTHIISAGNQAVMGLEDFIDILCENPVTRAIGVHIEGLSDIPKFERAALKALRNDTPIVAFKTGRSAIGSSLTISHTGSLSGANELYEALFERTGVISVTNPAQMLETLKYLCVVDRPKGNRIAGFTCSGGGATMLADHSEDIGLDFPAFTAKTTAALKTALPPIATVSNPLDYTTPIWGQPEFTEPVFESAISSNTADAAILVQDYPIKGLDESKIYYQNDAGAFAKAAKKAGIPAAICATLPENMDAQTREFLIEIGVAPMQGIHEALNAMAHAAWWSAQREAILKSIPEPLRIGPCSAISSHMNEAEGKIWLRNTGFPVPSGKLANAQTAAQVAQDLSFPVVLKMMGPKLVHKTEAGAVALNLGTSQDVNGAVQTMRTAVTAFDQNAVTDSYLIETMADSPRAELVVGLRQDSQFGWALTLGSGGILVELVGDAKTLLLPATQQDIETALRSLKVSKLLTGFRGATKVDLAALSQSILTLCTAVQSNTVGVVDVEINPLFVYQNHVLAVDALIQTGGSK
jgi:acyl-CoA synthetase (NDP forming)